MASLNPFETKRKKAHTGASSRVREWFVAVLSDGFELASAGTVMLPFNPHKVGATQREQQHGLT